MQILSKLIPSYLRCEYKVNPIGVDVSTPRLSWIINSKEPYIRNQKQSAYRILISSSIGKLKLDKGDLWDSQKVKSSKTFQIEYKGKSLTSLQECYWKVKTWDQDNNDSNWSEPAKWVMGLLREEDWKAKWIGYDKWQSEYDKKIKYKYESQKDKWIWFPNDNLKKNSHFGDFYFRKKIKIDNPTKINSAFILITADEKFTLFVNGKKLNQSDKYIFSWARPQLANVKKYLRSGENLIAVKASNSYVDVPGLTLKLYLESNNGNTKIVRTSSSWKSSNKYETDWNSVSFNDRNWKRSIIVKTMGELPWRSPRQETKLPPPYYVRKTFISSKKIKKAWLTICCLGCYEVHLNGRIISNHKLAPGWTDFNKRVNYLMYDVKDQLKSSGENVIGAVVADGWYACYIGWEHGREYYGKFPKVKIQLNIEYNDGTSNCIISNRTWKVSYGPVLESDILHGETYDARKEKLIEGWDKTKFNDVDWQSPKEIINIKISKKWHPGLPVKINENLSPVKIYKHKSNSCIFDFGQNFAGIVRLKIREKRGTKLILKYAEMLDEDGLLYTENIRMARATDTYFCKGQSLEIWEPKFTYHGFRYVEVTGLSSNPSKETLTGLVMHSYLPQSGKFKSSNQLLNNIYHNIIWSQKSNYYDIPTDCPQRDERLGWTGDAVNFIRTAGFNMDVAAFYTKWLVDLNDAQREDGAYPPIAPYINFGVGPLYFGAADWADAGIVVPYFMYQYYGDKRVLERYYRNMQKYISYLVSNSNNIIRPESGYGDWLNVNEETSNSFIGTAFFAYVVSLMEKISSVLNYKDEKKKYSSLLINIKKAFNKNFVLNEGTLTEDTQTAYVLALSFNLLSKRNEKIAIQKLVKKIEEFNCHLKTGFIGLAFVFDVLKKYEFYDIIYKLLLNRDFPSWGYMIEDGATTLWERWDGRTPENGFFDPTMNSFNHCSLGVVGEVFYSVIGGIRQKSNGFKQILLQPVFHKNLKHAKTVYNSICGKIICEWKLKENKIYLNVEIPVNVTAELRILSCNSILESNLFLKEVKDVEIIKKENSFTFLHIGSGLYKFTLLL